jgi:hypothetical protein
MRAVAEQGAGDAERLNPSRIASLASIAVLQRKAQAELGLAQTARTRWVSRRILTHAQAEELLSVLDVLERVPSWPRNTGDLVLGTTKHLPKAVSAWLGNRPRWSIDVVSYRHALAGGGPRHRTDVATVHKSARVGSA